MDDPRRPDASDLAEEWFWQIDGELLANARFPLERDGFDRRAVLTLLNETARLVDALRAELAAAGSQRQ